MTGGNGTGHGTGYDAGNGHAGAAAQSRNGPHFGMIPLRVATLRLPGRVHAVLVVIAFHAKGRWGFVSLDTIANESGIDRSKVCRCIRWLETKGVIEVVRRNRRKRHRLLRHPHRVVARRDARSGERRNQALHLRYRRGAL